MSQAIATQTVCDICDAWRPVKSVYLAIVNDNGIAACTDCLTALINFYADADDQPTAPPELRTAANRLVKMREARS